MNATEQAKNPEQLAKIASTVLSFKRHFPRAKEILAPWSEDTSIYTKEDLEEVNKVYRDSIDMAFKLYKGKLGVCIFLDESHKGLKEVEIDYWLGSTIQWQYFYVFSRKEESKRFFSRYNSENAPKPYITKLDRVCMEVSALFLAPP